jgi:hypothetical protein
MYKTAQPSGGPQAGPAGDGASSEKEQKKDEGVIDAEYVDMDKK